ncbi:hypothetical protein [Nesterenkonia ebinurensis]|uniref:hypothetical protein n=1 Tax=Nesterenkonia ebinurensis TaxID=2608252 RepID=UPI00123D345F|nr:hypothetical protein [Nesterenkonia ebinurensis]
MSPSPPSGQYRSAPRIALALSEALSAWAEASAQRKSSSPSWRNETLRGRAQLRKAEGRREAAITERLLMPRQF